MKDYSKIDQLLDRYWQCETSVEEEQRLQDFFLNETDIPTHLIQYQSLFEYRDAKQAEKLSDDFDEKILKKIGAQPKRRKMVFLPLMKIAASIALIIGLGFTAYQHHVRTEQAQARETVLDALFMISDNLQQGEEMILRGLRGFSPLNPPQGDF
jgi:hypothetical protein